LFRAPEYISLALLGAWIGIPFRDTAIGSWHNVCGLYSKWLPPPSDLVNHFKLETQISQHYTLEIAQTLQRDRGRRVVKIEKKWTNQRDLGYRGFGEVWLEENQLGETRAVNGVKKNGKYWC
jgi:hypothetical protein